MWLRTLRSPPLGHRSARTAVSCRSPRAGSAGTRGHAVWVDGCEAICAGLISGAALMGIGNAIINVLV